MNESSNLIGIGIGIGQQVQNKTPLEMIGLVIARGLTSECEWVWITTQRKEDEDEDEDEVVTVMKRAMKGLEEDFWEE